MTCPKCGSSLEEGARFCGACGSDLVAPAPRPGKRKFESTVFQGSGSSRPAADPLARTVAAPSAARPAQPASPSVARPAQPASPSVARPAQPAPPPVSAVSDTVAAPRPSSASVPAATASAADLVGTALNGRYLIKERVGEGGFGTVYRGEQIQMGRECALKVLHPRMARDANVVGRFKQEAQAASRLRNAHTVQIYDFDQTPDGIFYLAMELLHGRSLHVEMHAASLGVARVVHIVDGIADSLGEAHAQGIVHRDVKPENVFLETRGADRDFVKVLDFGIAKIVGGNIGEARGPALTAAGQTLGTLEYMSPEQLMGLQLDGRSDLYALGILAYELLIGHLPFPVKNSGEMITAHLKTIPPAPSKAAPQLAIPPLLDAVVLRLLEKDRARRYRDAAELQADLRRVEALIAPSAQPTPAQQPILQPISQPIPQPISQPIPQPISQPIPQPIPQPMPTQPVRAQASGLPTGLVILLVGIAALVIGLIIAGVILLRSAAAAETPSPAALVPSTMTALFGADVAELRASVPREQVRQLDEALRPKLKELGAEPSTLRRLAMAADGTVADGARQPAVLVVDGKIDARRFDRWAPEAVLGPGGKFSSATHKGTKYMKSEAVAYAFLPGDRLLAVDHQALPPILDRARGEAADAPLVDGAAAPLLTRVGAPGGRAAVFAWARTTEAMRRDLAADVAPEAASVQEGAAALVVAPQGGADARLVARTAGDDEARRLAEGLRRAIDGARKVPTVALLGFDPLLAAVQVHEEGALATASLHLTKPQFDDLVVRLAGFLATASTDGTSPPPPPPTGKKKKGKGK